MNNDNKNIRQETDTKPIIDLLALWEEVEDMISERRAIPRSRQKKNLMDNPKSRNASPMRR